MSERTRREVLYATGGAAMTVGVGGLAGTRVIAPAAAETATPAATVSTDGVLDLYVNEGVDLDAYTRQVDVVFDRLAALTRREEPVHA